MSYYKTIDEDLARAKQILLNGRADPEDLERLFPNLEIRAVVRRCLGGTIYATDTYAAYKLLESFVEEIERLRGTARGEIVKAFSTAPFMEESPELYDVARQVSHEAGLPWTDPRSGRTHPPPKKARTKKRR
jgi:hypothetical protein